LDKKRPNKKIILGLSTSQKHKKY